MTWPIFPQITVLAVPAPCRGDPAERNSSGGSWGDWSFAVSKLLLGKGMPSVVSRDGLIRGGRRNLTGRELGLADTAAVRGLQISVQAKYSRLFDLKPWGSRQTPERRRQPRETSSVVSPRPEEQVQGRMKSKAKRTCWLLTRQRLFEPK